MSRAYTRISRAIGLIAAGVVLLICLLILIGAHFYGIPLIAPIGSTVLSIFGPWLVVVPLGAGAFAAWLWRASHSRSALVLMIAGAVAAAWAAAALARMVVEAQHHGVTINLVRAFGLRILSSWRPDDDLVYGTWQDQPLHLIVYKPESAAPGKAAPVLLYIHGGGWSLGDRFEGGTNLRWFAERGWLVLSIDYTLSSAARHLWDTTTSQVGCAMAWTAANAARLGGDPARLSLLGSSAGGNLAINAAYLANSGRLESSCGGTVPRVAAVSALYPPVDLADAWNSQVLGLSDTARTFNTNYLGGSPLQFPDRYQFVASATHISGAAPPTLVIFGANDHLVPPAATERFAQQAQREGVVMEAVRFPYGDHAFNLNQYGIGNQFYLGMTERFLEAHGQRPGTATAGAQAESYE
jgi:acetyl esterase